MSENVLLNLLNELGKSDKCKACRAFYHFFTTSLINSITQEHDLSYDINITLKSHFWCENVSILPYIRNVIMGVIS